MQIRKIFITVMLLSLSSGLKAFEFKYDSGDRDVQRAMYYDDEQFYVTGVRSNDGQEAYNQVVAVDNDGELSWDVVDNDSLKESSEGISEIQKNAGKLIVAGEFMGDIYVAAYDPENGEKHWEEFYAPAEDEFEINSIDLVLCQDNIFVTTEINFDDENIVKQWVLDNEAGDVLHTNKHEDIINLYSTEAVEHGVYSFLVSTSGNTVLYKYDEDGIEQWSESLGLSYQYSYDIKNIGDDKLILIGASYSQEGTEDYIFVIIDKEDGSIIDDHIIDEQMQYAILRDIEVTSHFIWIMVQSMEDPNDIDSHELKILLLSKDLELKQTFRYDYDFVEEESFIPTSFALQPELGSIVLSGPLLEVDGRSFFMKRFNEETVSIEDGNFARENEVKVFPNPAQNVTEIHFTGNTQQITMTDLQGRNIKEIDLNDRKNSGEVRINTAEIPPGSYILNISSDSKLFQEKLIVE